MILKGTLTMSLENSIKLNALFLISCTNNNTERPEPDHSVRYFTDLVKTCDINITISKTLPDSAQCNLFDLIFIDLNKYAWEGEIFSAMKRLANNVRIVLFNAPAGLHDEMQLLISGVAGIFYQNERLEIVLRGITKLQKNERWFKRGTMNNALTELLDDASKSDILSTKSQPIHVDSPTLTRRENTIISLVSVGAKNQEIADQLHISPNTVKTHLYSIFRKTSSRNRIELIGWTQNYRSCLN
jgi:DNA-binding NarL/FixJ family response regulator